MESRQRVSVVIPVYRDGPRAVGLAKALRESPGYSREIHEIIIVDDGSNDGTAEFLSSQTGQFARVVALPGNVGRSGARNAGASQASGDLILFIDCDCLPATTKFIAAHLDHWDDHVAATIGHVVGNGGGFWDRYQSEASRRRRRQHAEGVYYAGSSQNLMVRRTAFIECGGFDTRYVTYGFEDRDLQIRLSAHGAIVWADEAVVRHMDELSLSGVARKMREAGGHAAEVFQAQHPAEYIQLGYAALDVNRHPLLRVFAAFAGYILPVSARCTDAILHRSWLPYAVKRALVRAQTAAGFLAGTGSRSTPDHADDRATRA